MIVKLLTTKDESNKVDKIYTEYIVIDGKLKDGCSILSPKFILVLEKFPTSNYAYIEAFNRYYFIDDITVLKDEDHIYEISMSVDVLMSFKDSIRELVCVIKRQENKYNLYLNDNDISSYTYPQVQTKTFPKGFSDDCYFILALNGNWGTEENAVGPDGGTGDVTIPEQ